MLAQQPLERRDVARPDRRDRRLGLRLVAPRSAHTCLRSTLARVAVNPPRSTLAA
jgi:hypothetical protein